MVAYRDANGRSVSASVLQAMERESAIKAKAGLGQPVRVESYSKFVFSEIEATLNKRLRIASQLLKDQVKRNINRPVLKYTGPRSRRITVDPESRSKPGEYPKKETATLQRSIFNEVVERQLEVDAYVYTTLGYGLLLETKMDRSFLRRTLQEMQSTIKRILIKPM